MRNSVQQDGLIFALFTGLRSRMFAPSDSISSTGPRA
jgi:hypothetical protein